MKRIIRILVLTAGVAGVLRLVPMPAIAQFQGWAGLCCSSPGDSGLSDTGCGTCQQSDRQLCQGPQVDTEAVQQCPPFSGAGIYDVRLGNTLPCDSAGNPCLDASDPYDSCPTSYPVYVWDTGNPACIQIGGGGRGGGSACYEYWDGVEDTCIDGSTGEIIEYCKDTEDCNESLCECTTYVVDVDAPCHLAQPGNSGCWSHAGAPTYQAQSLMPVPCPPRLPWGRRIHRNKPQPSVIFPRGMGLLLLSGQLDLRLPPFTILSRLDFPSLHSIPSHRPQSRRPPCHAIAR